MATGAGGWAAGAALAAGAAAAQIEGYPAGTYTLDPSHSHVGFAVSHLGFTMYRATFDRVEAVLEIDPADPDAARLEATVEVGSLDLPSPPDGFLDTMLGPDWFDAAAHPDMRFASERIEMLTADTAAVHGTLTLRGVAQPLTLTVIFGGGWPSHPHDPNARLGFSAQAVLRRSAFGMDAGLPQRGVPGVGDTVALTLEAEFVRPN